jgi:hypothetical protein
MNHSLLSTTTRSCVKTDPSYVYRAGPNASFAVFVPLWFRNALPSFRRIIGAETGVATSFTAYMSDGNVINVGYRPVAGANVDLTVAVYPGGGGSAPLRTWGYLYYDYDASTDNVKLGYGSEAANNFANDVSSAIDASGVKSDNGGSAFQFGLSSTGNLAALVAFGPPLLFNARLTNAERTYLMVSTRTVAEVEAHGTLGVKLVNAWSFDDAADMLAATVDSDGDFAFEAAGADMDDILQGNGPDSDMDPQEVAVIPDPTRFASGQLRWTYAFDRVGPDYPSYFMYGGKRANLPLQLVSSAVGFKPWLNATKTTPPGVESSANDASCTELSNGRWLVASSCYDLPAESAFYAFGFRFFLSDPGDRTAFSQINWVDVDDVINVVDGVTTYNTLRDFFDNAGTTGPSGSTTPTPWSDSVGFIGGPDLLGDEGNPDSGTCIFYGFPDDLASNGVMFVFTWSIDPDTGVLSITSDITVVKGAEVDGSSWQDPSLFRVAAADNALDAGVVGYRIVAKKYTEGVSASGGHVVGNTFLGNATGFDADFDDAIETVDANEGASAYLDTDRNALVLRSHLILSVPQEYISGNRKDPFAAGYVAGLAVTGGVGIWDGYGHNTPADSLVPDSSGGESGDGDWGGPAILPTAGDMQVGTRVRMFLDSAFISDNPGVDIIRFTTDGRTPAADSPVFRLNEPLLLRRIGDITIKAAVFNPDGVFGSVTSVTYTVVPVQAPASERYTDMGLRPQIQIGAVGYTNRGVPVGTQASADTTVVGLMTDGIVRSVSLLEGDNEEAFLRVDSISGGATLHAIFRGHERTLDAALMG